MSYLSNQYKLNRCRKNLKTPLSKQKGVVIVVALFIVAIVATMSYVMLARLARDTRRSSLIVQATQADYYAQGSVAWAMDQLKNNWEKHKKDRLVDIIPIQSPKQTENGFQIVSMIYDMQARFNINNLKTKEEQEIFARLIKAASPNMPQEQVKQIVRATSYWIAPGAKQNEFSKYYLQLKDPYQAAQRPMISISELRMVKGVTPALYQALSPYVTALPEVTKINVQTAQAPVLAALSPTMSLASGQAIEEIRKQTPFASPQAFLNLEIVKSRQIAENKITVVSSYFLVETSVMIESQHLVLYTLLVRKVNGQKAEINTLWQSKGVW